MSEAKATVNTGADLLNELLGIAEDSPVAVLRAQRAEIGSLIQGNYDVLLDPQNEAGVSRVERGLIALRVAVLEESVPLIQHYRQYLAHNNAPADLVAAVEEGELGTSLPPRLFAILTYVDRLTNDPRAATPQHLAALKTYGLSDANVVTISQLIAFLSFQVRTLVGLQLLGEGL